MRPNVGDILGGVQRTLMEEILPDLATDRGRERLTSVLFLLQHCMARWDRVDGFLKEEDADLSATVSRIAAERAAVGGTGVLAEIMREFESAAASSESEPADDIEARRASIRHRRGLIASLLGELAGLDLEAGSARDRCRREALGYARRQIGRDREWVQVGEITW